MKGCVDFYGSRSRICHGLQFSKWLCQIFLESNKVTKVEKVDLNWQSLLRYSNFDPTFSKHFVVT